MALPVEASLSSATANPGNSISLGMPTGLASGDVCLILVGNDDDTNTAQWDDVTNKPTGFDLILETGGGARDAHVAAFRRVIDGTESWPISVPCATSTDYFGFAVRVTGADTTTPLNATGTAYSGTGYTHALPSVTTTVDDCLIFYLLAFDGADGAPFSVAGTGFTESAEIAVGTTGDEASGCFGTRDMATAGAGGIATVTSTAFDGAYGFQFAIAGAAASGSVGSSVGTSTASATGSSTATALGSSSGVASVLGTGESTSSQVGSSSGTSTVSGAGASTAEAVGSSDGVAVVDGIGEASIPGEAAGSSSGTSAVSGVGSSTFIAVGSSAGAATVLGVGSSTGPVEAVGSASGSSTVIGIAEAPEVRGGGIGKRKRHRQFANIDGELIEVTSFKEAERLINHFNKGKQPKKPKKRRITFGRGPYVSVYDADAIPQKEIKEQLKVFYDDEEMLLLLLMAA